MDIIYCVLCCDKYIYLRVGNVVLNVAPCWCLRGCTDWILFECGCGFIACVVVTWCVCGWGAGYVCGYVLSRTSKMGFCVSVYVSFICNALYISNRSSVFSLCPFLSICRVFMVWTNVLYACPVSSICCANYNSNLGQETEYPRSFPTYTGISLRVMPWSFPYTHFTIDYLLIILSSDAIRF
jgi:hypothetical protein